FLLALTPPPAPYPLSLHDALPIYLVHRDLAHTTATSGSPPVHLRAHPISRTIGRRSEEAGMKVLVTGGAGYIGSTVASACLDEGIEPGILDSLVSGPAEITQGRVLCDGDRAREAQLER